jgi:glycosyltransferase involved in cell wall biosynthesis
VLSDLGVDPSRPTVAVCVRPWTMGVPRGWAEGVAAGLEAFVEQTGANLVFLPFHRLPEEADDVAAAERVLAAMRARTRVALMRSELAPEATAGVVAACDLVVGMRTHAVIFAALAGRPAVGLVYDAKVASVLRRLGLESYGVPLAEVGRLSERMTAAWARREGIREELAPRVAELRKQAGENATIAVNLLDARPPRPARPPETAWLTEFALIQIRKLAEQQAVTERLASAGAPLEPYADRTADVVALRRQVAMLSAELSTLTESVGWRLLEAVRGTRQRVAPSGTRRDRLVRAAVGALVRLAAQTGRDTILSRGRRVREWLERRRHDLQLARILAKHRGRRAVIFLPTRDQGGMTQRPQGLARALAGRGCVVFSASGRTDVDPVGPFAEVGERLYRCADFAALRRISRPIVIAVDGDHSAALSLFRCPFLIYDVLDDRQAKSPAGAAPQKPTAHAPLLTSADMVVVSSQRLLAEVRKVRSDALLVPNACDGEHREPDGRWVTPDDLAEILTTGRPIAGYFGPLAEVDHELLDAVARRLPHWWFVLIGPHEDGTAARLPARKNLRWLGLKEYGAVPAYMNTFDVAMIPFVTNDITRATFPTKLFEYMAADRPIVTTPFDEARDYASVSVAGGPDAFAAALEAAYADRNDPARRRLRATEREANTWTARAAAILDGVAVREAQPQDVAVVLAGVPMDDSGGGHRPAQLALELLARGWRVVYVHKFAKWEHGELRLAFDHPRLTRCDLTNFDVTEYVEPAGRGRLLVIIESPHPAFEPAIAGLRVRGARVVYDLIDDWASGLGAGWYDRAAEDLIAAGSDVLVASSHSLVAGLAGRTGRPVKLVPNAVNGRIFDPSVSYDRPSDLPAGWPQIMYVGSLWGRWFDWQLVQAVAEAYPRGTLTLIGDYRGQCPYPQPRNMFFLGLKAQRDLPGYLAHADVGLIPFQRTPLTQAMSHLKVFEYLAMRVPVVATPSVELQNLPHVHLAEDADAFVAAVGRVVGEPVDQGVLAAFTRANTWQDRIDTLLAAAFADGPTGSAPPASPRISASSS